MKAPPMGDGRVLWCCKAPYGTVSDRNYGFKTIETSHGLSFSRAVNSRRIVPSAPLGRLSSQLLRSAELAPLDGGFDCEGDVNRCVRLLLNRHGDAVALQHSMCP
jgi:hypothetical protein